MKVDSQDNNQDCTNEVKSDVGLVFESGRNTFYGIAERTNSFSQHSIMLVLRFKIVNDRFA